MIVKWAGTGHAVLKWAGTGNAVLCDGSRCSDKRVLIKFPLKRKGCQVVSVLIVL